MKAIIFEQHGGPEVLQYLDFPTPEPGPGQVQVRLQAAALNHLDIWVCNGWPGIRLEYPHIPGADGAGLISALGPGVTQWRVGDRVVINSNLSDGTCEFCEAGQDNLCVRWGLLGETVRGTYAQYVVVPDRNVLALPDGFPFDQAAAASLVFLTAWHSLITRGRLQRGESILIVGAGGGVNTASLQIAKYVGAKVYVVGSNMTKLKHAQELGADEVIDRSREADWSKAVYQLTGKRGVDVVVDNVGAGTLPLSMRAARKGGRMLTVGNTGGPKFEFDNRYMFAKQLTYIGSTMGTRTDFAQVMALIFAGELRSVVGETFALRDAQRAHERMEQGEFFGKIVLRP
ncbi:alcohol dehydrogenase, propanol-preferring [Thermoflexales bacterium]|nr:alcohol dehydrogenase, propanol-preferring [Thermoflexales bacterium]